MWGCGEVAANHKKRDLLAVVTNETLFKCLEVNHLNIWISGEHTVLPLLATDIAVGDQNLSAWQPQTFTGFNLIRDRADPLASRIRSGSLQERVLDVKVHANPGINTGAGPPEPVLLQTRRTGTLRTSSGGVPRARVAYCDASRQCPHAAASVSLAVPGSMQEDRSGPAPLTLWFPTPHR